MITLRKSPDIWSALYNIVPLARSKQLVFIVESNNELYYGSESTYSMKAGEEIAKHKIILLIIDGKATRSELSNSEREYFLRLTRESNVNSN